VSFPQINQDQVDALTGMATGLGAISVAVPDMKKDSYESYNLMTSEICDLNQLVILGLLKEVTDQCSDKLATMYAMSQRNFRVFEITDIGRRMFDGVERRIQ
jgi:hypothetical protein